jgi:hypothetical protein
MITIFGYVLLVLACAVVLLFAMFGELVSRVGTQTESIRNDKVEPLENAAIGRTPQDWPTALAEVADAERALLIVMSAACRSCADVMSQLSADAASRARVFAVVSCNNAETGRDFLARYETAGLRHFIDVSGAWARTELDIQISPVGLVLRKGQLESALMFTSVAALVAETDLLVGNPS